MNNEQSVQEIKSLMDAYAAALYEKDLDAMHKDYSKTNYKLFDVMVSIDSIKGAEDAWKKCFPYFDKPKLEYKQLEIHASDDMAVVHFRNRITGTAQPMPPEMENSWLRGTICFQKEDGQWKCIHEHISFPVCCETNTIAHEAV